jgi:hypothetical protein
MVEHPGGFAKRRFDDPEHRVRETPEAQMNEPMPLTLAKMMLDQ